jgi:hypothetical protein
MEKTELKKLKKLNNELISEGCNNFFVSGISNNNLLDDVFCLNNNKKKWEVYYSERGRNEKPIYSTYDLDEAIDYYKNYIMNMEHWHLIIITRSNDKNNEYKIVLENNGIKVIQNDIPAYKSKDDYVFRLFVKNKDIFEAKKLFENIPNYDLNN